jgi:hypothetical protein
MTGQRLNITNILLLALVVAMDACWIYAASRLGHMVLFAPLPGMFEVPEPLFLAGFEGAALIASAFLLRLEWLPLAAARAILGVLGLMAVANYLILIHPPDLNRPFLEWIIKASYITIVCLAVWVFGSSRYSGHVSFNDIYKSFRNGLIAMGLAVLFGSTLLFGTRGSQLQEDLGALPVWFFIWALAALGISHREQVREESGEAAGGGVSWNLTVGISMVLVLGVGLLTGALGGETIIQIVRTAFVAIIIIVGLPFYAAAYVLIAILAFLFGGLGGGTPGGATPGSSSWERLLRQLEEMREGFLTPEGQRPPGVGLPFDIVAVGTWAALLLAIVAVVWLASIGLRKARRERKAYAAQQRESFGSWALLFSQIREWLRALWARLRRAKAADSDGAEDDLAALRGRSEWSGTLSIREIYALLQKRAALLGYPRARHETPSEYLAALSRVLPNLRADLRVVTSAYIQARYGPLPISGQIVTTAGRAWERLEPLLVPPAEEGP